MRVGRGVCLYVSDKIPCKSLKYYEQCDIESLWISLRPNALPSSISCIIIDVIYHSTANREPENLREHIQSNTDHFLNKHPDAMVILCGDFNPKWTGLASKSICNPNNLKQLIKFYTRDTGILDWFCTNRPNLFEMHRLPKVASSDHYVILPCPSLGISPPNNRKSLQKIKFRQSRASNWRHFGHWMTTKDWSELFTAPSCAQKFHILTTVLSSSMDTYFPWKLPRGRPWITNTIKLLISIRQSAFIKHGKDSLVYKFWRNRVQVEIKQTKRKFYTFKVNDLAQSDNRKCWQQIKSLTGQDAAKKQAWFQQFLNDQTQDRADLASEINEFFVGITDHFQPLVPLEFLPTVIHRDLLATEIELLSDLSKLASNKALGPDGISNKLLEEFAFEFPPIICYTVYTINHLESRCP